MAASMMLLAASCNTDEANTTVTASSPEQSVLVSDDADMQPEPDVATEAVESSGCQTALAEPGDYRGINESAEFAQDYWVVVPDGYAETSPVPLVFLLSAGEAGADVNYEWWSPYLQDTDNLFVIASAPGYGSEPWLPDEVHLALIDQIAVEYCIDVRHVHAIGYSSSAAKAMRLACEAPDRIASVVASVAPFRTNCEPTRPVPLLAFTGDRDRTNTTASVEWWAEANGCDAEPADVDLGSGVTRRTYEECNASVVFYDIADTGHGVFVRECIGVAPLPLGDVFCQKNAVVDQLEEMDSFFAEHPLTSASLDL